MALFMPPSTTIHYKSAFTISTKSEDPGTAVRKVIRTWCQGRRDIDEAGKSDLSRGWFFTGDSEQHVCGQCHIRTASNIGKYESNTPEHWAFELIHGERGVPARLWSVNVGITRNDNATIRFVCLLRYGVRASYVGPLLTLPAPSVPKFMRDILGNEEFNCLKLESKINPRLYDVGVYGGRWMANQVCDPNRRLPIIIFAQTAGDVSPVDIEGLFKKNIGNANIYTITNLEDLTLFNMTVPYDHRLSDGMLRVYFRYSDKQNTGFRHRFYMEDDLHSRWNDINKEITFALSQNALSFMPNELFEIAHVIEQRRLANIFAMRVQDDSRDNLEYIKLLEDEIDVNIKNLDIRNNELMSIEHEIEEAQDKVKELSWQASQYAICIQEKADIERKLYSMQQEFDIPLSLHEVLGLAKSYWQAKIDIHNNAYKSAKKYSFKNDIRVVQEAWRMICKLATVMHDLKFAEQAAELENAFRTRAGIDFSMTESKTTKKDKRYEKLRTCTWGKDDITFYPHLKSAIRGDFRLHFSFLEGEQKILICHCGEHLDNAKTRHL